MRIPILVLLLLVALSSTARAQVPVGLPCQCPTAQGACFQCYDRSNPNDSEDTGICSTAGVCCVPTIGPQSNVSGCLAGQCGTVDDGCGLSVECGDTCGAGQVCNGGTCCTPATCTSEAANGQCGVLPDGCGGRLFCEPQQGTACSGTSLVACTHSTCPAAAQCGQIPDGNCYNTFLDCGSCPSGKVCAGEVCINPAPAMPANMNIALGAALGAFGIAVARRKRRSA